MGLPRIGMNMDSFIDDRGRAVRGLLNAAGTSEDRQILRAGADPVLTYRIFWGVSRN